VGGRNTRNIPTPSNPRRIELATYTELREQAARLLAEAEEMRRIEITEVIADIRQKMQTYGLTTQDLGLVTKSKHVGPATTVKYRGPNGETWVGGRGRKPDWILAAIKAGKDIDKEFGV
jgi:DNA-binding protein H-NS